MLSSSANEFWTVSKDQCTNIIYMNTTMKITIRLLIKTASLINRFQATRKIQLRDCRIMTLYYRAKSHIY